MTLTPTMAERGRRDASTARPGDIVNQAKQKRRTKEEIEAEKRAAALAKEEKLAEAAAKNRRGVKRAAAAVQELTEQDELARATAARPDLVTAELKRLVNEKSQQAEAEVSEDLEIAFVLTHCVYCSSASPTKSPWTTPKLPMISPRPRAATMTTKSRMPITRVATPKIQIIAPAATWTTKPTTKTTPQPR